MQECYEIDIYAILTNFWNLFCLLGKNNICDMPYNL